MRVRVLFLTVLLSVFFTIPTLAQDIAGQEQGLKPYGAFHGGTLIPSAWSI
jgi:hypothetical protein